MTRLTPKKSPKCQWCGKPPMVWHDTLICTDCDLVAMWPVPNK